MKRSSLVSSTGTRLFFLERCQRQIADQMHRFFFIVSSLFCLGRIKESFPPTPPPRIRITPVSIYQVILFDDKSHLFKERKKEIIARASKKNHGHTREGRLDVPPVFAGHGSQASFTSLGFDFSISSGVVTHAIRAAWDYFTAGRKGIAL